MHVAEIEPDDEGIMLVFWIGYYRKRAPGPHHFFGEPYLSGVENLRRGT